MGDMNLRQVVPLSLTAPNKYLNQYRRIHKMFRRPY